MPEIIPNWHPIFVHFTVALLSLSVILFVVTTFMRGELREQWLVVARWSLWFGAGITLLTGLAGLFAYNTVAHDTASHAAMTEHRNWAISVIIVFSLLAPWSAYRVKAGKALGKGFVALMLVGGLLLLSTAWHGGEAVYRYGLGVMSLPKVDSHQHDGGGDVHGHGDGEISESNDGHAHEHDAGASADDEHDHAHGTSDGEVDDSAMDFSGMDEGLEMDSQAHDDAGDHAH